MIDSTSLFLSILAATVAASGQLLLKTAMSRTGDIGSTALTDPMKLIQLLATQPLLWIAVPVYAVSFLLWLIVLSRLPLSVAYPTLAVTYIIVPVTSMLFLGEKMFWQQWAGIALIVIGIILTSVLSIHR